MQPKLPGAPRALPPAGGRVVAPPAAGPLRGGVVQRLQLIAVANGQARERDFTVLNNINFARALNKANGVASEKVASIGSNYSSTDVKYEKGEIIFVQGHGKAGFFEHPVKNGDLDGGAAFPYLSYDYAAATIIAKLARGYKGEHVHIVVLSCYGALPGTDDLKRDFKKPLNGFVEALEIAMKKHGMKGRVEAHETAVCSYLPNKVSMRARAGAPELGSITGPAGLDAAEKAFNTWADANPNASYQQRLDQVRLHDAKLIGPAVERAMAQKALEESPPKVKVVGAADAKAYVKK